MADSNIPNSDTSNEKGCETKSVSKDDRENKQMKITSEESIDNSEALRLSESQSDPVCILQMSGEQILAPETEDDGISIIPPSPGAYRDPPYLIPTSPAEKAGNEDSDGDNSLVQNIKGEVIPRTGKSVSLKDDALSEEPSTAKSKKPNSPCCKISFSQDGTEESSEITETQTSVGEMEVCSSRKRKYVDEPLNTIHKDSTCSSDKVSVQQVISRSKNHDRKMIRIETEREEEPLLKPIDSKPVCTEKEAEKQDNESSHLKVANPDSQTGNEEKEWHLQLSYATEPMEYSVTEGLSLEETQKDTSNVLEAVHIPDKELISEDDNCRKLAKDDILPLFQIQKPTSIEQSSTTTDAGENTTVFTHIQKLSSNVLEVSEELTDECADTPQEHNQLNSTTDNSSAFKNTPQSSSHTETAAELTSVAETLVNEMKDKNVEDIHLQSTQANGASNNLSQLISHKVIKGRKHPVVFTDTLEEECVSYKDNQTSSSIDTPKSVKYHKAPTRNKDLKQPINLFPVDESSPIEPPEVPILSPSKTSDLGIQVNIDSFECSKCSHQNVCSPGSDKPEVKDQKTYKKIVTTVRHITTQRVIVDGKVIKTAVIEVEDEPVIEYCEEDISPTISSHRTSISHTSFSSGELADVSSLVTSKSISSSSSSSLFVFPRSSSIRRSSSQEKAIMTHNKVYTHQDASTDTDIWSDTKQTDKYSVTKKNKNKWKLNSDSSKTDSHRSASPEISISDVPQPKQSRSILPGVRVMARWKDGCFYPGKVCAQDSDKNKWVILYDDGGKIPVLTKDLIVVSLLDKGQRVLALSEDGCYDPGIIKDYYKEGKEVGYVVERDYNETTRYPRSSVILSNEEAVSLLKSNADTTSTSSEIEQSNLIEGRRRQSPRVNVSQGKKEKLKSCRDPFVDASLSDQHNNSSDGFPQRRSGRKKLKQNEEEESTNPDVVILSCQQMASPKRRDSPSCKRKLHSSTNEQCVDIPCSSKKLSHFETSIKTGEKDSTFKSPKVQKAERCKISKLAGEGKKDNEKLFEGFAFLLSTADRKNDENGHHSNESSTDLTEDEVIPIDNVPFDKSLVEKEIEARGGTVLENIEVIQNMEGKQILLLSNDYLRTIKYIHCLAEGIPCVSHIWVKDCCATNKIQNYMTYILPAGFDIINKCVVEWHGRKDILKGLHILLFSLSNKHFVDTWSPVLTAAEAKIVHRIPPQRKSTDLPCTINAVVTDPSCPQNILRRAAQMKIPVLSVEWVIQCLITGHRLPVDSHPKFSYDFSA